MKRQTTVHSTLHRKDYKLSNSKTTVKQKVNITHYLWMKQYNVLKRNCVTCLLVIPNRTYVKVISEAFKNFIMFGLLGTPIGTLFFNVQVISDTYRNFIFSDESLAVKFFQMPVFDISSEILTSLGPNMTSAGILSRLPLITGICVIQDESRRTSINLVAASDSSSASCSWKMQH